MVRPSGLSAVLAGLLDRSLASARSTWLLAFLSCAMVYAATAHWYGITNIDTVGAAWPGWELVHHGRFWLEAEPHLPSIPWFEMHGGHLVSNRMAGVVLVGVPAQVALAGFDLSPVTPAILTAVVVSAAAMANLVVLLRRQGAEARTALAAAAAVALGTGMWSNAAAELWAHGPDALWLTLTMLALQRDRLWLAGLALSPALWTRPHLALVAAAIGVWLAVSSRSLAPALKIGIPTGAALGGLVLWNRWLFGSTSIGGAYEGHTGALAATGSSGLRDFADSAAGSLFSPLHGALVYSPFLVVGLAAMVVGLRDCPSWMRACAAGGLGYQIVQWKVSGFTGGTGLYSYRLPLEVIVLCIPAAVLGYQRLRAGRGWVRWVTRSCIGVSIAVHVIGVFWYRPLIDGEQVLDPWRTWGTGIAFGSRGSAGTVVAAVTCTLVMALALVRLPRRQPN